MENRMVSKILVTGRNREIVKDVIGHLEIDKGYKTITCEPNKTDLFDIVLDEMPRVVILCLGNETADSVRAYNVLESVVNTSNCTTIVITNQKDEKTFMKYTVFNRMLFLSRPVSLVALYDKLAEIEQELERLREKNMSVFREYVNEEIHDKNTKKKILVVDDDSEQLMYIRDLLEEFYDVTLVKTGEDAFRFLYSKRPDLVLLDYLMPGMDGPEVFRLMREDEEYADIPVIFLTGVNEKNKVIQTLTELRPQGYVIKPSKKSELVAKIIDVLG